MSDRETLLVAALQAALAIGQELADAAAQAAPTRAARLQAQAARFSLDTLAEVLKPCPGCGLPAHAGPCPHAEDWTPADILTREG